jgi:hypothetical protein
MDVEAAEPLRWVAKHRLTPVMDRVLFAPSHLLCEAGDPLCH